MTTLVPHRTHITKQSEHNILQSWNQHVSALWTKLWSFKMVLLVLLYIRTLWNWEINACKQINKCLAVRLVYLSPHTHTSHLLDCHRSRTASQCWGDWPGRAGGAVHKAKIQTTISIFICLPVCVRFGSYVVYLWSSLLFINQ